MTRESLESLLSQLYGWELRNHRSQSLDYAIRKRIGHLVLAAGPDCELLSEESYLRLLALSRRELDELVEELVVNESWFQREMSAVEQVGQWALSRLREFPGRPLRILSAPCACGEEPISLAALLLDRGVRPGQFQLEAMDLSLAAIQRAQEGIYSSLSFRSQDDEFRLRHFELIPEEPQRWRVKPSLLQQIHYQQGNLFELSESTSKFDVIFCRNLLIYLNAAARLRLLENLSQRLRPLGLLVVAACEFALPPPHLFESFGQGGIRLFVRRGPKRAAVLEGSLPPELASHRPNPGPMAKLRAPLPLPKSQLQPFEAGLLRKPLPDEDQAPLQAANQVLLEQAEQAADRGEFDRCCQLCWAVINRWPEAKAYLLLALVSSARKELDQSETYLRRALYLEPENREASRQWLWLKESRLRRKH